MMRILKNIIWWMVCTLFVFKVQAQTPFISQNFNNTQFFNEVDNAITAGNANQWLQQPFSPNNAMGTSTIMSITVSEDFPLLKLVSMIAPSPDWFAGIHGFSLRDGNNWKDNISINLFPYDAGTEDGSTYDTGNAASNPQQNIFSLINVAPFNNQKVGTLSINLESVLSVPTKDFKTGVKLSPNPTHSHVTISNKTNEFIDTVEIFDVIGKSMKKLQLNTASNGITINVNDLNTGIYLVRIASSEGNLSLKKLVIN